MNKKLLIIANNDGLPGVKKDVNNVIRYFKSITGGFWTNDEIVLFEDPSVGEVCNNLQSLVNEKLDYLVTYFSGHGDWKRSTNLYLNPNEEFISESDLDGIADRQLSIFDCCRGVEEGTSLGDLIEFSSRMQNYDEYYRIRDAFNNRILQARGGTHTKLYSCSIGEYSIETESGGLYTTNLLTSARNHAPGEIDPIILQNTIKESVNFLNPNQTPDYWCPKLRQSERVVFGIQYQINS